MKLKLEVEFKKLPAPGLGALISAWRNEVEVEVEFELKKPPHPATVP